MNFLRRKKSRVRQNPVSELGIGNARAQLHLVRSLKSIREQNSISVQDLADSIGVDVSVIYRFEKGGTNFTMSTLRSYAEAVNAKLELVAIPEHESIATERRVSGRMEQLSWSSDIYLEGQTRDSLKNWTVHGSDSADVVQWAK